MGRKETGRTETDRQTGGKEGGKEEGRKASTSHPHTHTQSSHPEGAVIGGAEHFGLVWGGDDSQSVDRSHVTSQGSHLFFRLNVPDLKKTHKPGNSQTTKLLIRSIIIIH